MPCSDALSFNSNVFSIYRGMFPFNNDIVHSVCVPRHAKEWIGLQASPFQNTMTFLFMGFTWSVLSCLFIVFHLSSFSLQNVWKFMNIHFTFITSVIYPFSNLILLYGVQDAMISFKSCIAEEDIALGTSL